MKNDDSSRQGWILILLLTAGSLPRIGGVWWYYTEERQAVGWLRLAISDAGVGMDVAEPAAAAGLGLVSIRERVRLVNGSLEIHSRPNRGAAIIVRIPDA